MKKIFFFFILFLGLSLNINAQNFKSKQRSQEKVIKYAYKKHKITAREYEKLMDEQNAIKYAIEKYQADGVWTPHEKNVVHDKLVRAEKRLMRYRTNGEIY